MVEKIATPDKAGQTKTARQLAGRLSLHEG